MKKHLTTVLGVLMILALATLSHAEDAMNDAETIKELIETSYVHGAFNELDGDAMRKAFHEDFAIYSADGEAIKKYPIATWAEGVDKRKASDEFDAANNVWEHRFVTVDVTGGAASVKIELSKDGKLRYTDYLSLLKFDSGWRIVAKVYQRHE